VATAVTAESMQLRAVLAQVDVLRGRPRVLDPLPGRSTDLRVKVTTPDCAAVVRLRRTDRQEPLTDRAAEPENARRAAESGASPPVLASLPDLGALVVTWVDGRALTPVDLDRPDTLARAADTLRRLHSGPRFVTDVDVFELREQYLRIADQGGYRLPDGYLELTPTVARVRGALDARRGDTVPCHNDLVAANIIDDGQRLWLVDLEYAGNNDPCFDLGTLAGENQLGHDRLELLVTSYFGRHLRHKIARARLYAVMARHVWSLWAVVQDAADTSGPDYRSWGCQQHDVSRLELTGAGLSTLLDEAAGSD
jgi:thiamine kinase-like enzyme